MILGYNPSIVLPSTSAVLSPAAGGPTSYGFSASPLVGTATAGGGSTTGNNGIFGPSAGTPVTGNSSIFNQGSF